MNKINHPYGNIKIKFSKFLKFLLSKIIRSIVNIFFKLKEDDDVIISSAVFCPWKKDKEFDAFFNLIKDKTLLDHARAYTLWYNSYNQSNLSGDILDLGCLLGGSGFLMAKKNNKGKVYMFDTFEGFQKSEGIYNSNIFKFSKIEDVKNSINKLNLKNTFVFKCNFPNKIPVKIKKIKLCHIDVNIFSATEKCFNYINKYIVKNGIVIFDDYGIWGADSIKKFINKIYPEYKRYYHFIFNYMGQCILIKK